MGIQVLGPLTVDGLDGFGLRDRVVLQVLVVRANEAVDTEVLADAVWAGSPPASWPKVVQGCVSRLRKHLGPQAIETTSYGGYVLRVSDDQLDSRRFERMVSRAREHLTDLDPDRASFVLDDAMSLWRGRALADLDEWEPGRTEAERLEGLRMDAQELRVEAEIAAGRPRTSLDEARALVREAPFRERRWALFARALYQSGRQSEALDVLDQAKRMLREELGLDPGTELLALEGAILRQDAALESAEPLPASLVCPYRGLLPYDSADAETFFGREADADACLSRLRARGTLAVVGPSGTGKSSLVRAGVVATLQGEGSPVLVTTPGTRPLDSLAGLPSRAPFPVLVVDQCEEAVTLCTDHGERTAYLDVLAAYRGPVVLALRADRLGELSTHPGFARLVERGLYLLSPLSEENLRAAIEGPARQAGLRLQPGLVDLLVREVEGEPGALPILSHVLRQTWERREGATLTVDGYRATGGIRDAVAQSAEHLYTEFDEVQQAQIQALFLRLVSPGDDGVPIRARVPRETLAHDEQHERLIDVLAAARLVSSDAGDVQIAHEALAREWPRLRNWLEDDVEGQRVFRHLAASAEGWHSLGRPDSELYRGVRLAGAIEWADRNRVDLTGTEQAFLDASRSNADRELRSKARSNRRLRLALAGVGALLVAALVAGNAAIDAAHRSDDQARIADSRRLSAEALTTTEPDLSVLLGVEAVRLDGSLAARSSLYDVLERTGDLVAVAHAAGSYVDVSPDGSSVAVTSAIGTGDAGQTVFDSRDLSRSGGRDDLRVLSLDYTPDGTGLVVAVIGTDPTGKAVDLPDPDPLRVLDSQTFEEVATYGGFHEGAFVDRDGLAISADGSRLAVVAWLDDNTEETLVWDTDKPTEPVLRIPMPEIYGRVLLSPDGETVYVVQRSGKNSLRAFDVDTGTLLRTANPEYRGERESIIALSPDGSTLAHSDVSGVVVMDATTFEPRFTLVGESEGVNALQFGPDPTQLAAGYADGEIVVWDLPSRGQLHAFRGHTKEVTDMSFSPDGHTLYSVAPDGLLLAWDLDDSSGFPGWRTYPAEPEGVDLARSIPSPDGTKVLYQSYGNGVQDRAIQFRDLATGDLTPLTELPGLMPDQYVWSPDSSMLLTVGIDPMTKTGWMESWDPETGASIRRNDRTPASAATFTTAGTTILAVDPQASVWRIDPATLEVEGPPIALPDLDAEEWDYPTTSPDDRTLLVRRWWTNNTVAVMDLATGRTRDVLFPGFPDTWAFSPDGTGLAVYFGGESEWVVLDVEALREGRLEYVHEASRFPSNHVWQMTYSTDGSQLVTTGNGVVDLWDAETLAPLGSLTAGSPDDVATARAMPGHTILIAQPRGKVLTWDTREQHVIDLACGLAGRNLTHAEWNRFVENRAYELTCPDVS
ncbi:BTAD domain-containing putative transcriptional regulator [Cellulomonas sp. URHD0024]|uniref:nSTAND1 domain-containing NTPase n=1 Tax=Cellulomonas sp. URHD0024 TaxID=1302620 RepID=UPI00041B98A4|nr:BTAD domain-containing putative transcriptional regulator [Cellulomonas sp. URHD0024]